MHIDKVPVASVFDAERFFSFLLETFWLAVQLQLSFMKSQSKKKKKKVLNSTF